MAELSSLDAGQPIIYGGNKVTTVSPELAAAFGPGDRLVVVNDSGAILHIPAAEAAIADAAVSRAADAFAQLGGVSDAAISSFFEVFAARLADDDVFAPIAAANAADVDAATAKGRSTTRLVLSPTMRRDMIEGLRSWRDAESGRDGVLDRIEHQGWTVEQRRAGLGVVGFVFEGRPNVFADACGVIRSGNTVVFRIGSDALGTAQAIVDHALDPAIAAAGLPAGSASLVASAAHAAGYAMFSDSRLALAVARGSGEAVAQLGAVARQAGVPVSLHGTGGAWIVVDDSADQIRLHAAIRHSLDRKVCNTVNTVAVPRSAAPWAVPVIVDAVSAAAERRGTNPKLHVVFDEERAQLEALLPADWLDRTVDITRAEGVVSEPQIEPIAREDLGREFEWEESPELSLVLVEDVPEAVQLFNTYSPRFVASLIGQDNDAQQAFWDAIDAPFVGDGFTRWVDGQYALNAPELGLSNWQFGRLFSRGGVLSGDSVYTVRLRVSQSDPDVHR